MGQIICAATEKGGAGKTTFITNAAVHYLLEGERVALIDLDPQRSALTWSHVRREDPDATDGLNTIFMEGSSFGTILDSLRQDYDKILLDVPGADGALMREVLLVADLVVIPSMVGGFGHLTSHHTLDVIEQARSLRHEHPEMTDLKAALYLNQTRPRSVGARGMRTYFAEQLEHVTLCRTELHVLDDYWTAAQNGLGVLELDGAVRAKRQIRELARELDALLS